MVPWDRPSQGSRTGTREEGICALTLKLARGFFDEQAYFPMSRVIAERDG